MAGGKLLDKTLEAFKVLIPYLRGSLWWVRNDILKEHQPSFNQNDNHIGHPALSVRYSALGSRYDPVPMLMGTTGGAFSARRLAECVKVLGLSAEDPDHACFFGTIVEPGIYSVQDLLDGVIAKNDVEVVPSAKRGHAGELLKVAWHKVRTMYPNWHKPMVNVSERTELNNFCMKHGI